MFRITTRDVGFTQVATIWAGETKVIEFYTGTKHTDFSIEIAEEIVAEALRGLIVDKVRIYSGEDYEY